MQKNIGFTLIELMIVVAIVAILAAVALPSYQDSVRKSRRSDGFTSLTKLAIEQEKYRVSNTAYASALTDFNPDFPATSDDGYYALSITASGANNFTLSASGASSSQSADTGCVTLTLTNNAGVTTKGPANCWQN